MDLKKIEEIKNNILKQMEQLNDQKESKVKKKDELTQKERDNERAKNWQKRYIETNKKEGKQQISCFITKENLALLDGHVADNAKQGNIINRSDVFNDIIQFYFKNKGQNQND